MSIKTEKIKTVKNYKRRINITTDSDLEAALAGVAKRDGLHITTKATELLRYALELEEDLALASVADRRVVSKSVTSKLISHESAWK